MPTTIPAIDPTTLVAPTTTAASPTLDSNTPPTIAATGLDKAAAAGQAPRAGSAPNLSPVVSDALKVGVPGLLQAALGAASAKSGPSPLDLVAGKCPNAVPLSKILETLSTTSEGRAALTGLAGKLEAVSGITLPAGAIQAVATNAPALVSMLALSPKQLSDAYAANNAAPSNKPAAAQTYVLPQSFDLGALSQIAVKRPEAKLVTIAPGLLTGDIKSSLADDQAKTNIVLAELFTRLAERSGKPAAERFTVTFAGKAYDHVGDFLAALVAGGHTVEVTIAHRIANFANLKTRAPDGRLLDVPAPLMVRTGCTDAQGNEAAVPAVHSELRIAIRGSALNADIRWFQGVHTTGFVPTGLFETPAWLGNKVVDTLTGRQAQKAVEMAGLFNDVIDTAARTNNLKDEGYGITGVCNDSVAIIQHALTGRATGFPLIMRDAVVLQELARRLGDTDVKDDPTYRRLKTSIDKVPSDVSRNRTLRRRALESMPWPAGEEPLQGAFDARRILTAAR
jgi:hypothetical protein